MRQAEPSVSVIIPAHNEADHIGRCIESVKRNWPLSAPPQVVVVNNRSTDATPAIALASGAEVLLSEAPTIARVRNEGVEAASGSVLVFLDGDCEVTREWSKAAASSIELVLRDPKRLTGAHPLPPAGDEVFLWQYWFYPLFSGAPSSHIGSAHLICSRRLYEDVGGFSEHLETGEDVDFCRKVKDIGGVVQADPGLLVIHRGYPTTIRQFYRRERWHGRGDAGSVRAVMQSRVAIASVAFAVAAVGGVLTGLLGATTISLCGFAVAAALLVSASLWRFRRGRLLPFLTGIPLFAVFFVARAHSLLDAMLRPSRG